MALKIEPTGLNSPAECGKMDTLIFAYLCLEDWIMRFRVSRAKLLLFVLIFTPLFGQACPVNSSVPAGSPVAGAEGPQGPAGPQGPQGPPGQIGAPGSNATVMAGTGITVSNGQVSLDT